MKESALGRILVVDDEQHITESVQRALDRAGYAVDAAQDPVTAWNTLERTMPDVVLCDIKLHDADGMDLLSRIRESYPDIAVVMMTGFASIDSAVRAIKSGATDYLAKPFNPAQLRQAVANAMAQKRLAEENRYLKSELQQATRNQLLLGENKTMLEVFANARRVAATGSSVLITGKSGTGKEVLARFIHSSSPRAAHPFITVNCAAVPPNLIESELFGHRRGAFTGAVYSRRGSFELANAGTLFLDEIGEMPGDMQAKILRALEDRRITRVGSEEPIDIDVRIIAATNKDLTEETRAGRFREDLYWRLNVVHFTVPALSEHREDIVALARHFLTGYAREQKKAVHEFSRDVVDALERYDWPGNVRELRNAVERAVIFAEPGLPIRLVHLPAYLRDSAPTPARPAGRTLQSLREVEADYIREVLEACGGNRAKAAEILGLSVVTLWRKLRKEGQADDESPIGP